MPSFVTDGCNGAFLDCRVTPASSRDEIVGAEDGFIRIRITAAPVDGKANKGVANFLSKYFRVPKSSVKIVRGETGRRKKIFIEGRVALNV